MTRDEFERAVLRLWATTRIPLTRANLLLATGAPRERLERWMNDLVLAGLAELDSDDEGEALWRVRGAERAVNGPRSVDAWERRRRLEREVEAELGAPVEAAAPRALATRPRDAAPDDEKSVLASGLLSFVFGPFGWLYAAPVKDALAGIAVVSLVAAALPATLAASLLGVCSMASGLAGVVYAQRYNRTGQRRSLADLFERPPRLPG